MEICEYAKALGEVLKKFDIDALADFINSRDEFDEREVEAWDRADRQLKEFTLVEMIENRTDLQKDKELQLKVKKWKEEQRLTIKCGKHYYLKAYAEMGEALDKLGEYEDMEEEGKRGKE